MTAPRPLSASFQHIGLVLTADGLADLPDAELVGRFAERREEAAFAALVRRYGPVVFGVCRRVLRHEQDAEDAFQAAFLVFARNAGSVGRAGAVGNWLYGVAHNVARKARAARRRREHTERQAVPRPDAQPVEPDGGLRDILDAELHALPEKYRAAVVLCDLMGLTAREAADRVGCPAKTLGTRLARGRLLLARRLTRRGVALSAAALPAALAPSAAAAVPAGLLGETVHAASGLAAGSAASVTPAVAALTRGVTNAMLSKTLKWTAALACGVFVLAGLAHGPLKPIISAAHGTAPAGGGGAQSRPRAARPVDAFELVHRFFAHILVQVGVRHAGTEVAEDKKDDAPAPSGAWDRKGGETRIDFPEKDVLKVYPHGRDVLAIVCKYAAGKDGVVKATVTGFEGKQEVRDKAREKLPVGTEFTFKWSAKDDAARLADVTGEKIEPFKSVLEGDYAKKK